METTPEETVPPGELLLLHSASFLVLDLALRSHPLSLGGFTGYSFSKYLTDPPVRNLHVNPHLEHACPYSQCASLFLSHLLLLVGFKLLGLILWELEVKLFFFQQCKELCKCRAHQRMSRGQLALSRVNQSPCTFFFVVCVSFYHREGGFCS